jgi:hypothetical protein
MQPTYGREPVIACIQTITTMYCVHLCFIQGKACMHALRLLHLHRVFNVQPYIYPYMPYYGIGCTFPARYVVRSLQIQTQKMQGIRQMYS